MVFEKHMREDPIYKVLEHLRNQRSKLPQICEKEGDFAVEQFITKLEWLIKEEAPEHVELFEKDIAKSKEVEKYELLISDCNEELAFSDLSERARNSIESAKQMFEQRLEELK